MLYCNQPDKNHIPHLLPLIFNTFNNISVTLWQSVLLVEETGVPGENHRPVANHIMLYQVHLTMNRV